MDLRLFIADDSEQFRSSLRDLLLDVPGVQIAGQAGDVNKAINGIRQTEPDAVILDLKMPGGTGLDVLKRIKAGPLPPTVIILTGYPYPEYRKAAMDAGADRFFEKGVEEGELVEVVKELVTDAPLCKNGFEEGRKDRKHSGNL
jgi:DNA-binding NarL/FixJ family response regulator